MNTITKNPFPGLIILILALLCVCMGMFVFEQIYLPQHPISGYTVYSCLSWGDRATTRNEVLLDWLAPFRGGTPIQWDVLIVSDTLCGYTLWLPILPQAGTIRIPY
jgi:hypothetical protein